VKKSRIKLYPSSASSWFECKAAPGFIAANKHLIPKEDSDPAAIEGHTAHELAAGCLILGEWDPEVFPTAEMAENVRGYMEFIEDITPPGAKVFIERKITPFYYQEGQGNSYLDCTIIIDGGRIIRIVDYKNGRWSVQAKDNKQLTIYGKTVIDRLKDELPNLTARSKVELFIYQPKPENEHPVREWKLSKAQLEKEAAPIGKVAKSILKDPDNQPFAPSPDTCFFCDAADFCTARAKMILADFAEDPEDLLDAAEPAPLPGDGDPRILTTDQLIRINNIGPALTKMVEGTKAELVRRDLKDPGSVPGFKAVAGWGRRAWKDEEEAVSFLEEFLDPDEIFTEPQLVSPAGAESLLRALRMGRKGRPVFDALANLYTQPPGGPTLATIDDNRDRYQEDAAKDFDDMGD
jgi:hypothetical protein